MNRFEILTESQAEFRQVYRTTDHLFTLTTLIDHYTTKNKKPLFLCFIDFRKAFDKVDHELLWRKISNYGAGGKFLDIIKLTYEKVKSCVMSKGGLTNFFSYRRGVRQGCLLSPLLFSLYLNDLVECLERNGALGVELRDIRLYAMLYADDLILLAENDYDLKLQMDILGNYTIKWGMEIKRGKTKVIIFNDPMKRKENGIFYSVNNRIIRITKSYKYLGVILNNKHSYKAHVDVIVEKANKCLFTLITKNKEWKGFEPTLLLYLFDHLISPILSYGCKIWGNRRWDDIEKIHLFICKYALGVKKSTPSDGIYAELGRVPLSVTRQIHIIKFAIRSWSLDDKTLVKKAFKVQLHDDIKGHFNWISEVTTIMKDNNMYELQPSMYDIGTRLKEKFYE